MVRFVVSLSQSSGDASVFDLSTMDVVRYFPRNADAADYAGMTANFYAAQECAAEMNGVAA